MQKMADDTKVSQVWKLIATGLGSFVLALSIAFASNMLDSGDEFVKENHFSKKEVVGLINKKIDGQDGLQEKLKNFDSQLIDRKKTDEELRKAIVDLRIEIARWADASEKNRNGE